jgi:hypothetical protein
LARGSAGTKRIAFFDTNAILRLFDYWECCASVNLKLDGFNDITTLQAALIAAGIKIDILSGDDLNPIHQGMTLFQASFDKKNDWDIYTSCICTSEFYHTLLEKLAAERLVSQGIPYRFALERPLIVFRKCLKGMDYSQLQKKVEKFNDELATIYNIPILIAEKTETDFDIVSDAAAEIWSRILMDVMDTLIYASAITSMANILITRDSAFRSAVINLHKPPDSEWRGLRRSILLGLSKVTRTYSLPEGRGLKEPYPAH